MPTLFAVLVVIGSGPPAARADEPPPANLRVRVTVGDAGKRVVGQFVAKDGAMLVIKRGNREERVPLATVTRIETSRSPSRKGRGAGIGALAGMALGGLIGYAGGSDCKSTEWFCFNRSATAVGGALLGLPIGAGIGASLAPGEKWEPLPLDRFAFSIVPARGRRGVRLALAVAF